MLPSNTSSAKPNSDPKSKTERWKSLHLDNYFANLTASPSLSTSSASPNSRCDPALRLSLGIRYFFWDDDHPSTSSSCGHNRDELILPQHAFYILHPHPDPHSNTDQQHQNVLSPESELGEDALRTLLTIGQSAINWSRDWINDHPALASASASASASKFKSKSTRQTRNSEQYLSEITRESNRFIQQICGVAPLAAGSGVGFISNLQKLGRHTHSSFRDSTARRLRLFNPRMFSDAEVQALASCPGGVVPRPSTAAQYDPGSESREDFSMDNAAISRGDSRYSRQETSNQWELAQTTDYRYWQEYHAHRNRDRSDSGPTGLWDSDSLTRWSSGVSVASGSACAHGGAHGANGGGNNDSDQ